jgi:uncharacterized membrane protein
MNVTFKYYTSCSIFPKNQLPAKLTVSNDFLAGSNGKQKALCSNHLIFAGILHQFIQNLHYLFNKHGILFLFFVVFPLMCPFPSQSKKQMISFCL